MFPFIDYTVNVILWHVLHLTCFVTKKASHDTILVMLLDTIFDDLLLYLYNDLISSACKSRKKIKSKLQTVQNRCIRYCLQQDIEVKLEWKNLKKLTDSRFVKDLISTFVLSLLHFLRKLVLYVFMIYVENLVKINHLQDLLFWN